MPNDPRFTPTAPRRIEILAFPEVQLLDVSGPLQVFASVNDGRCRPGANAGGQGTGSLGAAYQPLVVAATTPVISSAGLGLSALPLPDPAEPLDTLVVAGGFGIDRASRERPLIQWLQARAARARRVASVCSGAFLLAEAGLLDGRRAVTHWSRCAEFARRYPAVRLEPDPIFIEDGAVWSSAGITAGIDLSLALVEADLGRAAALAVARQLVVFLKRPGGQSQFSATLALQEAAAAGGAPRFEQLHAWVVENLEHNLSLPALARVAGMSERSFVRHYRQATGLTPARAVERLRVEAARRLLEEGWPLKRIASRCGFGSEETMRRSFLRQLGITAQDYRARFAPL